MEKTITIEIPADFSFEWAGQTLTASHLEKEATLLYCVINGFKQSIVDAAAVGRAEVEKLGLNDAEVEALKAERQAARFEKIISGTIGAGGGAKLKGFDAILRDVGQEMASARIIAHGKAKGIAIPAKSSEAFKGLVADLLAKPAFADLVRKEAEERQAKALALASFDLDD